ncbi:MAG: glycoside hydrolase [Gemmatimonadetes bacterium]|nr:glycoside hydrolase [Gemmatimonadota bacterium]
MPINLVILWHMHQPHYRHPKTGIYELPWVRLHAAKDYVDMPLVSAAVDGVAVNFNLVPSLLEQVEDYVGGGAIDEFEQWSLRADSLSAEEAEKMLRHFFSAHGPTMIRPSPRYYELLLERGDDRRSLADAAPRFSTQDYIDLAVHFNLAWVDPTLRRGTCAAELLEKDRDFTMADVRGVLDLHRELLGRIVPTYRSLAEAGRLEISTTPFYHPILPLLIDHRSAREALPAIDLPRIPFAHIEDARSQIVAAKETYFRHFGTEPVGLWPAEGSVSESALRLVGEEGFKWCASDEEVLKQSVDPRADPMKLYLFEDVAMVFRDHTLSDRIGFVYSKWGASEAVEDLLTRIRRRAAQSSDPDKCVIPLILDGENAWEHFPEDGAPFLRQLYESLAAAPDIRCRTIGDLVEERDCAVAELGRIRAGSWIRSDFSVWIGHAEDNHAWDLLARARECLTRHEKGLDGETRAAAWKQIHIAEGSDWNWWYGPDHHTPDLDLFDRLYRAHLQRVYELVGQPVPAELLAPIANLAAQGPRVRMPRAHLRPIIDGEVTHYFEWLEGGVAEIGSPQGPAHRSDEAPPFGHLRFGFDPATLYLLLSGNGASLDSVLSPGSRLTIEFVKPCRRRLCIEMSSQSDPITARFEDGDGREDLWTPIAGTGIEVAYANCLELACPLDLLGARPGMELALRLILHRDKGDDPVSFPEHDTIRIEISEGDPRAEHWVA